MSARQSLLIVVQNGVGAVLGAVGLYFLGQSLGPGPLGMVAFALALARVTTTAAKLGLDQAHIKRVAEGGDLAVRNGTFLPMKNILSGAVVLLFVLAAWAWDQWRGFYSTTLQVVALMAAWVLVSQMSGALGSTFQGLRRTALNQFIQFIDTIARVPAAIVVAVLYAAARGRDSMFGGLAGWVGDHVALGEWTRFDAAFWYAAAFVFGALCSWFAALWLWRRHRFPVGRYDPQLAKTYVAFAAPLALLAVFTTLGNQVDAIMVGFFWSASDVGHYYAAHRVTTLISTTSMAVGTLLVPMLTARIVKRDVDGARRTMSEATRLLSLVMAPIVAGAVVFAPQILRTIVAAPFVAAAPILAVLAFQQYLTCWTVVTSGALRAMEATKVIARVGIIASAANITLNLLLIPDSVFGIPAAGLKGTGAAIATLVAATISLAQTQTIVRRRAGGNIGTMQWVRHAAAAAVAAAVAWGAAGRWLDGAARLWELLATLGLLVAVYLVLVILLRALSGRDIRFFLDVIHPGRMARYAAREIRGPRRPGPPPGRGGPPADGNAERRKRP